ncbi:MAG: thiaminase II [Bacillota bacterium]|nr:thiaminase II [Bacillota bacterium]
MGFAKELRRQTDGIWQAIFHHPFVMGMGDGTLPERKFRYWLHQDYLYLKEYARMFALGAAKAPDLETMGWFARLFDGIVNFEMEGHRRYAQRFGLSLKELEEGEMAPTGRSYTRELLYTSWSGSLGELTASLLPCLEGYAETADHLRARGLPENPFYREWIEMYTSREFKALGQYCGGLLDRLAEGRLQEELTLWKDRYVHSARYEYLFWEMCWQEETWPV